ncbi:MAG: NAD(P)-dependent alcohol dehydrogenase [Deltaproteobacteria bacterium]|nr:NAD(P)-dependent alcohol dehydrogenase [Deltaproteobacteria bacterium]
MKAVVHTRYGPPDVLQLADVERPVPRADQVRIRIHATTVNRTDCAFRAGKPAPVRLFAGLRSPNNPIPGTEFAGVIDAVGRAVQSFAVGDRVFGRTSDERPGAHAEYLCVDEAAAVVHQPEGLSHVEAAALCDGVMLANAYLRLIDFDRMPRIVINGASGSIGSAGVQLAKARGAEVTAVCKTDAITRVKALGADHIIDYTQEDFTATDTIFDVVFDAVGKSSLRRCKRLLREGGIYVSTELGFLAQNPLLALRTWLFGGRIKVYFPLPKYGKAEAMYAKQLVERGQYQPLLDRTYRLDEIVDAHEYVETEGKVGNVVITVVDDVPS